MRFKILIVYLLLLSTSFSLYAQTTEIKGTVTDEMDLPLPGVNILIKNQNTGTITDLDGVYTLKCSPSDTLVFSFVGYEDEEFLVGAEQVIDINLTPTSVSLEDVVVVGYGTQKKASVVGAIGQVKGEELARVKGTSSLVNSLSGLLPGLTTLQTSGQPGGSGEGGDATQFLIRAKTTWNGSGAPLVLVDGIERQLADINPNDVETVSVLKDASATAVYGVKGGNGVIMITTKRGMVSKPILTFTTSIIASKPSKIPTTLRSYEGRRLKNEAIEYELPLAEGESAWPFYTTQQELEYFKTGEYPEFFPDTYWPDELIETGYTKKMDLGVQGGTEFIKYFASLAYLNEDDIVKGRDYGQGYEPGFFYKRYNYRSNLDFTITKTTQLGVNISGYYGRKQQPAGDQWAGFWQGLYTTPTDIFPVQYSDGLWGNNSSWESFGNPVMALNDRGMETINRSEVNTDFTLKQDLSFITRGLSVSGLLAYDNYSETFGPDIDDAGSATRYIAPDLFYTIEPGASTDSVGSFQYPEDYLRATHGFEYRRSPVEYNTEVSDKQWDNTRNKRLFRNLQYQVSLNYAREFGRNNVSALAVFKREENTTNAGWSNYREDWVGRATYNFDERYFLELNGAYNGSEKFDEKYRFGFFPSAALGYIISNESFFKNNISFINLLKFRYSSGSSGSDEGPRKWEYLGSYSVGGGGIPMGYPDFTDYTYPTTYEGNIANPDAHWETAKKRNLGIELGVLQNLVTLTVDIFDEHRTDMYIKAEDRNIPDYAGGKPVGANIGEVKSNGYEIDLKISKAYANTFHWWLRGSLTEAHDEVIFKEDPILAPAYQKEEGYAINQPRSMLNGGLTQNWDDVYANPVGVSTASTLPGSFYQIDYNADGITNESDRAPYNYTGRPQNTYSFLGGLEFRGFSIMVQFYGVTGVSRIINLSPFGNNVGLTQARQDNVDNSWLPGYGQTEDATYAAPRLFSGADQGNVWSTDASYLRLKNAEVSYTFSQSFLNKVGIKKLRIYCSGNNLVIWTKMVEDRETGDFGAVNYPLTKNASLGLDVTF